ncbi:amidohydrolase [Alteromonas macleodii]|uniref:amidohydrolase n=1 Tax=Alteromonas macleodii TaxID=28108 RepID=UPI002076A7AC|nr:amidohydrolase [Alteromonas macleodii]USI27214.1 amidohydrolase [Alteromonas macleodii]
MNSFLFISFGLLISVFSICASAATVFTNATVWTGVEGKQDQSVVAIDKGKIIHVGNHIPKHLKDEKTIDLDGKFVMHGFTDNHVHFMEGGAALASIDLRPVNSPGKFTQLMASYAKNLRPHQWILNGNWDHQKWGGMLPNKSWIDPVTLNNPVYVIRIDGHQALVNSLALKLAGIDRNTPNPKGGIIVRDEHGEPTGLLKGNALNLILDIIPSPSENELMKQFAMAQDLALSLGISKVHAITAYPSETTMLDIFKLAEKRGIMKIRAFVSTPIESWEMAAANIEKHGRGNDLLSYGGVKGFIDGSLGARTAWFHDEYSDEPGYYGLPLNDPEQFATWMTKANEAGLELSIHALGDKGIDFVLNKMEELGKGEVRKKRFRIEHFQHPTRMAIKKLAELGVIASMQPYHAIDDGQWAEERIGPERLPTAYAFKSILEQGGLLTFGSDWPVAPLSPFEGIYAAVTRSTLDNANPQGWIAEQKISVEQALTAYTVTNSYALNAEQKRGTLEKGKFADFVILSHDPRAVSASQIRNIQVLKHYINGELVYEH